MNNKNDFEQFGVHLMVDGYGAPFSKLRDKELLKHMLDTIPAKIGMHNISEPYVIEVGPKNRKDPGGLSGFVLIAESHLSFHTFPSRGFVTIDMYTCQDELPIDTLITEFKTVFEFKDAETHVVKRGSKYPTENIYE